MFLETPVPGFPLFLKLDFSTVPILFGSFMFGPAAGVAMAAIKALINLLTTSSAGVGQIADFLVTGSFAFTAGLIYRFKRSRKGALIASAAGVLVMTLVAAVANYYIIIPFYARAFMPMEAIIAMCQQLNANVTDIGSYVLYFAIPFNLLKGTIMATVTFLLYKRLSKLIQRYTNEAPKARSTRTDAA